MDETQIGSLYDFPRYYDLVYGSDWKAEYDFLSQVFSRYAKRPVKRIFEPACGTGRLLFRFGKAGYDVAGLDLNEHAVRYCNRRLARHGLPESVVVRDMCDFRLRPMADVSFNMINSFRHLLDEREAVGHLEAMAAATRKGGLYVLGLHLTPVRGSRCEEESWSARRGFLTVLSELKSLGVDLRRRRERCSASYEVYTPTQQFRLADELTFRTYTGEQMDRLIAGVSGWELVETFDFAYEIDHPVKVGPRSEDMVYVLRRV